MGKLDEVNIGNLNMFNEMIKYLPFLIEQEVKSLLRHSYQTLNHHSKPCLLLLPINQRLQRWSGNWGFNNLENLGLIMKALAKSSLSNLFKPRSLKNGKKEKLPSQMKNTNINARRRDFMYLS